MNINQYKNLILVTTLEDMDMYSKSAVALMLGTVAQESNFNYIKQLNGPALGLYQMEPVTIYDLMDNYIKYHEDKKLQIAWHKFQSIDLISQVPGNLYLQVILARYQYYRQPAKLPDYDDIKGLAKYWKKYWNTELGKGTEKQFINNFEKVQDYV